LNKGLGLARGEIIARLDADDIAHSRYLEMEVAYLERHPEVAIVGSNYRFIDEKGRVTGKCSRPEGDFALRWLQFFVCPIGCGVAAFRNSVVWNELGGFDETIIISQDWDLCSRLMAAGHKVGSIPEFLVDVRRHPGCEGVTSSSLKMEEVGRILRMNPERILGIDDRSKAWLQKIDTFRDSEVEQPEDRMVAINALFDCFCLMYPGANEDPEVMEQLFIQYARTIIKSGPKRIGRTFKSLKSSWPDSIKGLRTIYHLFRIIPYAVQWRFRS